MELSEATRSLLQTIVDVCPSPMAIARRHDGLLIAGNRLFAAFFQEPLEQLLGRLSVTLFHLPAERLRMREVMARLGMVTDEEVVFRKASGETFWGLCSCRFATVADVEVTVSTFEDIGRFKRAEADLHTAEKRVGESEEGLRSIVDAMTVPFFIAAAGTGQLLFANQRVADTLHTTVEKLMTMRSIEFYFDLAEREQLVHSIRTSGSITDFEIRLKRIDGSPFWALMSAAVTRYRGAAAVVSTLFDLTKHKKLELELRQAQKLESLGRLASGIAHEINTPMQFVGDNLHFAQHTVGELAAVLSRFRVLRDAVANGSETAGPMAAVAEEEQRSDLDYSLVQLPQAIDGAIEGVGRVADIVRAMKGFALPDQSEMTCVDLNVGIRDTLIVARNEYKDVAVVETELGELPEVTCFASEINQVILNLVVNSAHAIEATQVRPGTYGRIVVATRTVGDEVEISVADNGCGIPASLHERIFDPFFTTKEVGRGTGQGLAVSRSVVCSKHGGRLWFDSEVGKGTTFYVRLPTRPPVRASAA